MSSREMIPAADFCLHHQIEISFLTSLHEYGLIEITSIENDCYLSPDELDAIEKLVRLHYDLHINLEGLDAVQHLLQQMENMQTEIAALKNRLQSYEE